MSGNNNFQKHARSLFQAGVSLLQQVSQQQRNDSSDEEQSEIADSEDFIANGQRGIVVYKTYSVKSDREKILHLNLYKAQIVQYYDSRKRTYQCEDVQSISHNSDNNIVLEVKRNMNLQSHFKKIIFPNDQLAHEFHQYIEFMNESGKSTKSAFNQIDYKRTGIISGPDLKRALAKVDLDATEQDISNMYVYIIFIYILKILTVSFSIIFPTYLPAGWRWAQDTKALLITVTLYKCFLILLYQICVNVCKNG